MLARLCVWLCLFSAATFGAVEAATIVVKADGTGDYPTIQAAVDAAAGGDEIVLEPGTYTGQGDRDIDFAGKAVVVRSTDPDDPAVVAATVLDCGGTASSPHRGFRFASGEGVDSVVAGLTIRSGYGPTESIEGDTPSVGGAVACIGSSPTLRDLRIVGNAAGYGGGVFCYQSSPAILRCTISGNAARFDGGGIYCARDSAPVVADCTITGNSAQSEGGGLALLNGSDAVISDSTISTNTAVEGGGGVHCFASSPTLSGCTIADNTADEFGGGLDCVNGSLLRITDSRITGNSANFGGGVNSQFDARPTLRNCVLTDNATYAVHNASRQDIDAAGCYWGTTDHAAIAAAIFDGEDSPSSGLVIWCSYVPDFGDDGIVDILDLVALSGQWGQVGENLSADLNCDGFVDILDVLAFLEYWQWRAP